MQHTKIKALLISAASLLKNDEAPLEAKILLQHVLKVNHAWLIAHADDAVNTRDTQRFQNLLQRRINGEPIAYILGEREFYGLSLKTTPDTLIPRPDTETLVEAALDKIPAASSQHIIDLGTGTGAIALAIAKSRPQAKVTAVDFSKHALTVAQSNADNLNINNVTFIQSNWFDALENQMFDLIVSNPPYIEEYDPHLNQGDLRFEPRTALASGADGLNDIRQIIQQTPAHLSANGWLMFEHGYRQAHAVSLLLNNAGFTAVQTIQDLGGNGRVTIGKWFSKIS